MRTVAYVLLLIVVGLVAWYFVPVLVVDIYLRLGGKGTYVDNLQDGGLGILTWAFLYILCVFFGTIFNGALGYWLTRPNHKITKPRLYLTVAFVLIVIPAIATYLLLRL